MFTLVSILLLLLFAMGFWLVKESKIYLWMKVSCIVLFFSFCVFLAISMESQLGWAAVATNFNEVITIRSVVIKEPNKQLNFAGSIYLLLDMPPSLDSSVLNIFGHKSESIEPRLFKLPYSRNLHEELEKSVIPKLRKGQVVKGKLQKADKSNGGKGDGSGKSANRNGSSSKDGSGNNRFGGESLKTEFMFYELPPSYFLRKDDQ